jgi:hypothetical protein
MAKKERNRGSVDRARAKRATAPNPAGEPSFRRLHRGGHTSNSRTGVNSPNATPRKRKQSCADLYAR